MPRKDTHLVVGALAGGVVTYLLAKHEGSKDPFMEAIGGALGGLTTACLPDWIEPAFTPSHRASAHSVAAGAGVSMLIPALRQFAIDSRKYAETPAFKTLGAEAVRPDEVTRMMNYLAAGAAVGLAVGYLAHLVLDGHTPAGLPFA